MLLPDNMHPKHSIYYNASLVIAELNISNQVHVSSLFEAMKNRYAMSFMTFVFCLDWLYLINVAETNNEGFIELCS